MSLAELQQKSQGEEFARRPNRRGDKIERFARPIARAIDKMVGTKIEGCGGCKKMKERLNAGMPLHDTLMRRIKGQ